MYKNVASQIVAIYAHDTLADEPETGDAANITADYSLDGGAAAPTNDANPTELSAADLPGVYIFNMLQAETNCDLFVLVAQSTTAEVQIEPVIVYTMPSVAQVADAVWDEVLTGATHNVPSSAGRRIRALGAMSIIDGTVVAADVQSVTLDADASAEAGVYTPNLIVITGGTGAGQTRMMLEYSAEKVAIVDRPWTVLPEAGVSEYQLIAFNSILLASHGIALSGTASTITVPGVVPVDVGCVIFIAGGTGAGETRLISEVTIGAENTVIGVAPDWTTTPDATTVYKVLPVGLSIVASMSAAAVAQVNAEVDTALADYDGPTNAEMEARTLAAAAYATAANQTTLLARLGAFTGSGVNTVLGFFKALMSKVASTPSDVGGTFSAASDSTEAIRDALSTASVTVADVVDGDKITVRNYTSWSISISDITNVTDTRSKLYFTVKDSKDLADDDALCKIEESAGLLIFDRTAASDASLGSLAFSGTTATISVDESLTGLRKQSDRHWDLKEIDVDGKAHVRAEGTFSIGDVVTQAIT